MDIWFYVGVFLFIWAIYDLFLGKTWIHREIDRRSEPVLYWIILVIWFLIAIWLLI